MTLPRSWKTLAARSTSCARPVAGDSRSGETASERLFGENSLLGKTLASTLDPEQAAALNAALLAKNKVRYRNAVKSARPHVAHQPRMTEEQCQRLAELTAPGDPASEEIWQSLPTSLWCSSRRRGFPKRQSGRSSTDAQWRTVSRWMGVYIGATWEKQPSKGMDLFLTTYRTSKIPTSQGDRRAGKTQTVRVERTAMIERASRNGTTAPSDRRGCWSGQCSRPPWTLRMRVGKTMTWPRRSKLFLKNRTFVRTSSRHSAREVAQYQSQLRNWITTRYGTVAGLGPAHSRRTWRFDLTVCRSVCHLTDLQRKKLQLAGRGDIKRLWIGGSPFQVDDRDGERRRGSRIRFRAMRDLQEDLCNGLSTPARSFPRLCVTTLSQRTACPEQ